MTFNLETTIIEVCVPISIGEICLWAHVHTHIICGHACAWGIHVHVHAMTMVFTCSYFYVQHNYDCVVCVMFV